MRCAPAAASAVLTDPTLPRGSDRVHAALADAGSAGPARRGGEPAGRPAEHSAGLSAHRADAAGRPGVRHRDAGGADRYRRGGERCRRWSRRPARSIAAARCRRRCISRARRSRGATGRAGIISASMPSGVRRWRVSSRCRKRRWSGGRAWNSFAPWRPACASPAPASNMRRTAWTRRPTWNGRVATSCPGRRRSDGMTGIIAFQGVPGAYSDLACRVAYPDMTTLPCKSFETRDGRGAGRACGPRHAAVREQPGGPGAGYPPPAARIRTVRHRRAFSSCRALPARGQGRRDRRSEARAFAYRRAGPGAPQPAPARADAGGAGRHGGRRSARRAVEPEGGGRDRLGAGRRDLRAGYASGQCRGRGAQHDAVLRHGAPRRRRSSRRSRT